MNEPSLSHSLGYHKSRIYAELRRQIDGSVVFNESVIN